MLSSQVLLDVVKHEVKSFGVFTGKGRFTVQIRFDAFAARLVGERTWHASQKMKPLGNGELEMTLLLGSLEEIERWILSWGSHARVLKPARLVGSIRRASDSVRRFYE